MNGKVMEVSQADAAVGGSYIVEQLITVLADERFLVVACHIMPSDTIVVHIVQHTQAGLIGTVDVKLGIVRLADLLVACR